MEAFKIGNATVRIHGEVDREKLKAATTSYLKKVEAARRRKGKERKA